MSRERQKKQSEEVREQILDTARQIIEKEGVEFLSVRSITRVMGYSAGIIYHYFKDKDEILTNILMESYRKIIRSTTVFSEGCAPDEAIRATVSGYIESALAHSSEYKALMISSSPAILALNTVLGEDDAEKRPAIQMLIKALEEGIASGIFADCDAKLAACYVWSAMFGLVIRLITEGDNVTPERRAKLVDNQINMIMKGLRP